MQEKTTNERTHEYDAFCARRNCLARMRDTGEEGNNDLGHVARKNSSRPIAIRRFTSR